ncbi:putative transmembrane protein [Toxoplasma gondii GAB2-2007-GAL-DOM2]|uniref:Transmembrane protein n=5 Tax=Toxoplasma gondii TaxID=5811 RepID=S7UFT5_TOXGG|nr:hypothetical protein TGGT1_264740 [Toxoplasma gondii GT1]KAF4644278.1 hypothetical protein TGRH88_012700 [Toxoplasma gondii]KFG38371.1 putative transmembrane protein [Toxoplasma gondii GAB2-2007-GAL-DOM2]KFG42447.1 putative transmembrane protein [Toxoplasma gondii FOU]RQX73938.1 putative transmembrane protein [Toxoplasma gondii CAST]
MRGLTERGSCSLSPQLWRLACFAGLLLLLCLLIPAACQPEGKNGQSSKSSENGFPEFRFGPAIRPRKRIPSRQSAAAWMRLFADMTLTELALPATVHSTLNDVNAPRYMELTHAQNVDVTRQLYDGIRSFDVRPWRNSRDGKWYSEAPWRLEEDLVSLRKAVSAFSQLSTSPIPALPNALQSIIDLHSRTSLEESLFRPVQRFLRSNGSEVAVVVFSTLNGNRRGAINSVEQASSLGAMLKRYAEYNQPGAKADPTNPLPAFNELASPKFVEGHPGGDVDRKGKGKSPTFEVVSPSDPTASFMTSAVRKPLMYEDVQALLELIDRYWGQLLPRHEHVFFGPPEKKKDAETAGSTAFPGTAGRPQEVARKNTAADVSGPAYPMAESVNRPELFAKWLRQQGEMWLSEMPLRDILGSRVQLLLFVDDPLVAWYITTFSREHVMAFVAGDHIYDISYRSEALFAPCGISHRTGPIGDELALTKERSWKECRSKCESLSVKNLPVGSRGACTYWTFGPVLAPTENSQTRENASTGSNLYDCRTFTGSFSVQNLAPLVGAVTQPADCGASSLLEDPMQWSASSLFSDLTDEVCPITGAGVSAVSLNVLQPFARELCLLDTSGAAGGANRRRRDKSSAPVCRGVQALKKFIRVHFAPSSPLFYVDGTRGGKRHFGTVDVTVPMNRLTVPWVYWHLERQQLLQGLLSGTGESRELPAGISRARGGRGGQATRPVNALMLMRYDSLNNEIRNGQPFNYFEMIMHLNPLPAASAALALEGDVGDFSAEHYLHLTAFHSFPGDSETEALFSAVDFSKSSNTPCKPMIWLVVCVAILCLVAMIVSLVCGSSVLWKQPPQSTHGDWAAAPIAASQGGVPTVVQLGAIDSA